MVLYDLVDVEQRYKRSLVEEEDLTWNPEQVSSAENVLVSVQIQNESCIPRQPIPARQEWNEQSKTLKQVREICTSVISYLAEHHHYHSNY